MPVSLFRRGAKTNLTAAKRRRYSAEFKANVALEALKGDLTVPSW